MSDDDHSISQQIVELLRTANAESYTGPDHRRSAGRRATDGLFRIGDCALVALPKLPFDGSAANDPIYNQERRAASLFFVRFSAKLNAKIAAFYSKPLILCQIAFTALLRAKLLIVFSFFPLFPASSQCQINCSPTT